MEIALLVVLAAAIYFAPIVAMIRRGREVPVEVKIGVSVAFATLPVAGWFAVLWAAVADFSDWGKV